MINVFSPQLGEQELAEIRKVFDSGWIGRGPKTREFEEAFSRHLGVGAGHVNAVNSCTEALFMAMELLRIGPGDEVVMPSVGWVGAANAVAALGGRPVFCDVEPRTLNATAADVEAVLTPRTKAVIILHYGGYPGDVAAVADLCAVRGVTLVEDAACAVASTVDGRAVGTFGDLAVWSFDANKIVVTGDGGMIYARDLTDAAELATKAQVGVAQTSGYAQAGSGGGRWWEIDVTSFSRRSIINDVTAAMGCVQLGRLAELIAKRRAVAERYDELLDGVPGIVCPPPLPAGHQTSYFLYWVQLGTARDAVARHLFDRGVYTTFRYPLLHRVAAYGSTAELPGADQAAERTLCLPLHPGLSNGDVERVVRELRLAVRETGR